MVFEKHHQNEQRVVAPIAGHTREGESVITSGLIKSGDGRGSVDIRLAECDREKSSALDLISRRYAWRGYGFDKKLAIAPVNATFTASCDDQLIGTITLAVDSPAGLIADKTFADEIKPFRDTPGAKLCELGRFAFDQNASSKPMLAALFHVVLIYGYQSYGCTDLFIEVSVRHVRFYESMLGFRRVSGVKIHKGAGAPGHLMWLKVDDIRAMIDAHASGLGETNARSLYPFFLPKHEERRVFERFAARRERERPDYEIKSLPGGASRADVAPRLPNWIAAAPNASRNRAEARALA